MSISHDIRHLEHIIYYCQRLEDIRKRYGDSLEQLRADEDFKDVAIYQVIQIKGHMVRFTDNFKQKYGKILWREIIDFGNIAAYQYYTRNLDILFSTITTIMPNLKKYCEELLANILAQQASEETG